MVWEFVQQQCKHDAFIRRKVKIACALMLGIINRSYEEVGAALVA